MTAQPTGLKEKILAAYSRESQAIEAYFNLTYVQEQTIKSFREEVVPKILNTIEFPDDDSVVELEKMSGRDKVELVCLIKHLPGDVALAAFGEEIYLWSYYEDTNPETINKIATALSYSNDGKKEKLKKARLANWRIVDGSREFERFKRI